MPFWSPFYLLYFFTWSHLQGCRGGWACCQSIPWEVFSFCINFTEMSWFCFIVTNSRTDTEIVLNRFPKQMKVRYIHILTIDVFLDFEIKLWHLPCPSVCPCTGISFPLRKLTTLICQQWVHCIVEMNIWTFEELSMFTFRLLKQPCIHESSGWSTG